MPKKRSSGGRQAGSQARNGSQGGRPVKTPTPVELRDAANDAADQLGQELPEPTAERDEVLSLDQQLDLAWRAQQGFEKLREKLEKDAADIESRLKKLADSENDLSSRSAEFERTCGRRLQFQLQRRRGRQ